MEIIVHFCSHFRQQYEFALICFYFKLIFILKKLQLILIQLIKGQNLWTQQEIEGNPFKGNAHLLSSGELPSIAGLVTIKT